MKDSIVTLLQDRMGKCTTEQFWAVATISGMNAFVVTEKDKLIAIAPLWLTVLIITLATAYGCWFTVQRHMKYYFYRKELATYLKDEKHIPGFLKHVPAQHSYNTLSGVSFYIGWMIILWIMNMLALVHLDNISDFLVLLGRYGFSPVS